MSFLFCSGSFLEVITCFLRGTKYCMLDEIQAEPVAIPLAYYNYAKETTDRDWIFAKKVIVKGNLERGNFHSVILYIGLITTGKKTIVHTLRVVLMLTEIVENGTITDFTIGIDNYYLMTGFYDKDWQFYEDYFGPILKESLDRLVDLSKK